MGQSCEIPDGDREFILDKVKVQIMEALGPPPPAALTPGSLDKPQIPTKVPMRILRKRHSPKYSAVVEDTSQVILFPTSDVLCETPDVETLKTEGGNSYTYVFRPSTHIQSRRVSSVQFWFFTGKSMMDKSTLHQTMPRQGVLEPSSEFPNRGQKLTPSNSSNGGKPKTGDRLNSGNKEKTLQVDIQILSEEKTVTVETIKVQKMGDWTVFYLAPAFHSYLTRSLFVLLVHCPNCPCSDEPENTPFLMFHTLPAQRGRRSTIPWSPSALELLQRPPALGADSAQCHRGSINITFEELGWNQWIVYPGSFQFHYCHGTCSPSHGLSLALHWGNCCAALPSTMKPLRVTTTTDGGFSFRYEVVPNLLTQDCACS
ncbi:PREDICTED: inhibin alpha chain [Nanorana parkeri]|uniref:inhibin alpha chain n=1 Tax=Nanorana parkeri TaxID=125878 RepID=UPI0008545530|nr:PREDICTED: inhibin alpha chain [Nanorana parkeri]